MPSPPPYGDKRPSVERNIGSLMPFENGPCGRLSTSAPRAASNLKRLQQATMCKGDLTIGTPQAMRAQHRGHLGLAQAQTRWPGGCPRPALPGGRGEGGWRPGMRQPGQHQHGRLIQTCRRRQVARPTNARPTKASVVGSGTVPLMFTLSNPK